jgi:hypothetical protein
MREIPLHKLGTHTTKLGLSKVIGCHIRSVHNYHQLAVLYIDDFLSDYPQLHNERLTKSPLTQYQCWVIWKIHQYLQMKLPSELLRYQLENDSKIQFQFSKQFFNQQYPEVNNNDDQTIRKYPQLIAG